MLWHHRGMKTEINQLTSVEAMRAAIQSIAVGPDRGRDIGREHAAKIMSAILSDEIDSVQVAVFLIALRMKRESMGEFMGILDALLASIEPAVAGVNELIVLADPFDGYVRNVTMTPFIPAVLAACGLNSVMHGVETVGPKHGVTAHKIYKLAGINTGASSVEVASGMSDKRWGYVDQRQYAPQLFALQDLRDRIVKRTALTTIERLLMPIAAREKTHLTLGYVHRAYPEIYACLAKAAGYQNVLLLKGVEGGLAPALNKPLRRYSFDESLPVDEFSSYVDAKKQLIESESIFESASAALSFDSESEPVECCLEVGLSVLAGKQSVARDSLALASAQILIEHQQELSLNGAVEKVFGCLDNGSAEFFFNTLRS